MAGLACSIGNRTSPIHSRRERRRERNIRIGYQPSGDRPRAQLLKLPQPQREAANRLLIIDAINFCYS